MSRSTNRCLGLLGYDSLEDLQARTLKDTVYPDDWAMTLDRIAGRLAGRIPAGGNYEFRLRHRDGSPVWVEALSRNFEWQGRIVSLSGVTDLTSRKRAEEALRRSQRHLEEAQRIAATGSAERDLTTGKIEWSRTLYRLLGVDPASFQPTDDNVFDLIHDEDRARVRAMILAGRVGARSAPAEFRVRRPDGEIRTLYGEIDVVRDRQGTPLSAMWVLRDVTELRAAEQALRAKQRLLERAERVAAIGSIELEFESGSEAWSDEMYRILGIERSPLLCDQRHMLDFVHESDRERVERAIARAKAGKPVPPGEVQVVRSSGEIRIVYVETALDRDPAGRPVLITVCRDVTELRRSEARQREMEQQLAQAQKLEALGTLAGGVAHELNNTLVPILGLAKLTLQRLPEGSREQNNLGIILQASERARDLVGRILALSRSEMPTRSEVDLAELARRSLELLRRSLPATMAIEGRIEPVAAMLGDPGQLSQTIINLVVNAVQATPDQTGTVVVEVAPAPGERLPQTPGRASGPAIRLSVIDRGVGMDKATKTRIFEPFFTTKAPGQGTGLGLSVVHRIVTQHGGHIVVESEVGEGTRFDVYLPLGRDDGAKPTD